MPWITGVVVAALTGIFARVSRFDRDRSFYPTVLVVIAAYYVLFAAMSGLTKPLIPETIQLAVFAAIAVAGFRWSPWIIAAGLTSHGLFDLFHGTLVNNPGVPAWWPAFCSAADVGLGAIVAFSLLRHPRSVSARM